MKTDLTKKLENGYLLFYGYSYKYIPDQVQKNYTSRMNFYFKPTGQIKQIIDDVQIDRYSGYQDTGWEACDVVFFDQDAVKSLLIGYPANAKYVLINCANFRYFHWIISGLLRRILIRQVRFLGLKRLTQNGRTSIWLVLARKQLINTNDFYLSGEIGIEGFLNHLRAANTDYVVPRFFESLPELHRKGGDLDLIVSDKDEKSVKQFLLKNEGDIRVDIWTVSKPNYHGMTYMPPHIAQDILDKSIEGKASAKIPNQRHSLNCMIFHALYHKGFQSGIPSKYNFSNVSQPNNDYLGCIKKYANQLDLTINYLMEDLDEYMLKIGWRPALDALAKIAQWNEWVRIHHFEQIPQAGSGLFAMILKSEAVERGFSEYVATECKTFGYEIILNCLLEGDGRWEAIQKIRGGVWNDGLKDNEDISRYYPARILVLMDQFSRGQPGISQFKNYLRSRIDDTETSFIHSSDNDMETWDYVKICVPDQEADLKSMVDRLKKNKQKKHFRFNRRSIQFQYLNLKSRIKSILVSLLSH